MKYYSQCGQDKWIVENVFNGMTYGYFVDVGAANGVHMSNTYTMEQELMWSGLCIEPHDVSFEELKANRKCAMDNNVVLDGSEVTFNQYGSTVAHQSFFSSIIPHKHLEGCADISKTPKVVKTKTLFELFRIHNVPTLVHYMSLDVEGAELTILKTFFDQCNEFKDFRYRIMSLTVEHNFREPERQQIRTLLEENDYVFVKGLMHDDGYVHKAIYPTIP